MEKLSKQTSRVGDTRQTEGGQLNYFHQRDRFNRGFIIRPREFILFEFMNMVVEFISTLFTK